MAVVDDVPARAGSPAADAPVVAAEGEPPPEWWARWTARGRAWAGEHPGTTRVLLVTCAVASWVSLVVLGVVVLFRPDLRLPLRVLWWNAVMVAVFFVLARTKTVSWSLVGAVFALGVPWLWVVDKISRAAAAAAGVPPLSDGGRVGIAGILEEVLKLTPLLLMAVLAPGRVRRFAIADWAVLGFASGASFNTIESAIDVIVKNQPPRGMFAALMFAFGDAQLPERPPMHWNPITAGAMSNDNGLVVGAGHAAWTTLAAICLGLAVTAWRAGAGPSRFGWRLAAPFIGAAGLVVAISEHISWNARLAIQPDVTIVGFPAGVRTIWTLTGKGHHTGTLLGILFVTALLIDAHHRRAAMRATTGGGGPVAGVVDTGWWNPVVTADRLTERARTFIAAQRIQAPPLLLRLGRRLFALASLVIHALCQWAHDLGLIVTAHQREPGESRLQAMRRGRAGLTLARRLRTEVAAVATPGHEPAARRSFRRVWLVIAVVLLIGGFLLAVSVTAGMGGSAGDPWDGTLPFTNLFGDRYLAGMLDCIGDWWDGLGFWGQMFVTFALAATIVLFGASIPVAMTAAGIATYGFAKAHGAATFTRDPDAAVRNYVRTATPQSVAFDVGEALLTFVPAGAGAGTGRIARTTVTEFADDPQLWTSLRREAMRSDAGAYDPVELWRAIRREPGAHTAIPADEAIPTIRGRAPINSGSAGKVFDGKAWTPALQAKYPEGVMITKHGFPDFSPYAVQTVKSDVLLTGDVTRRDLRTVGLRRIPDYSWHHLEDGLTMQLVPQDLHEAVRHTGGAAISREMINGLLHILRGGI